MVDSGTNRQRSAGKTNLNTAELVTVKVSKNPTTVVTANGEVLTKEEATMCVKELDLFVTVMFLDDTPTVLSLGKLYEDHGYTYHWTSGQKPQLIKHGTRIECNTAHYVPFVVPSLSTSSSSSSSPGSQTSSSQESLTPTQHPASTRSESMSDEVRGDSSPGPAETENSNKNDNEGVRGDPFRNLQEWLEEFKENLVDDSVPEHRDASSSSCELPSRFTIFWTQATFLRVLSIFLANFRPDFHPYDILALRGPAFEQVRFYS